MDWQQTTIGEVASLNDESLSSKTPKDYEFRYVSIDDVSTGSINGWTSLAFAEAPSRARRIARQGDILLSTVRPYLKSFTRVNGDDTDLVVSTGFAVLRAGAQINPAYLYQLIFAEPFIEHLKELMTGSNYPAVKPKDIAAFPFALPPVNEQHRIAEILSSVDASIHATRAVIEQAECVKRGLMEELLTGGLGSEAIERGEVPEGWCLQRFGEIASVKNGFAFKSKDFVDSASGVAAVVRMSDLKNGTVEASSAKKIPLECTGGLERFRLEEGDFVFGMSGSLSNHAVVPAASFPLYLNQRVGKLEARGSDADFLRFLYTSEKFMRLVEKSASGNAQLNISSRQIESFQVLVPPKNEQRQIAEILLDTDKFIARQKGVMRQQKRVKRGLMDDLLTGKVRTV
jgi:type I restriction enzyme S subunit